MRNAFIEELIKAAEEDDRIFLLCGDLGYSVLEGFSHRFPERYINVGIAEQNMAGIAAGLALSGFKVFTYSIANFAVARCLEQIRNDIAYHGVDVTVVAVGGGLSYGAQGYSHHGIEDVSFTRSLPGMKVIVPADVAEASWATRHVVATGGPAYLRLGRGGEPRIHQSPVSAIPGTVIELRPHGNVAILSSGTVAAEAVAAADILQDKGIFAGVYSVPYINPLDADMVSKISQQCSLVVTVEEHVNIGGLGSAIAEMVAQIHSPRAPLLRLGVKHLNMKKIGSQSYLRSINGIDALGIATAIEKHLFT